jgi:hypothetical protein
MKLPDFLFINASNASVPSDVQRIRTRGHSVRGRGSADYIRDASVTAGSATTFVTANNFGFRLAADQRITIDMFGAMPDDHGQFGSQSATDNYPAFQAAFAWLEMYQVEPAVGYAALPELHMRGYYYCGTQLELKAGNFSLVGEPGTRIRFPADSNGIIIHSNDTIGETTQAPGDSGANSTLRGFGIQGSGGSNREKHGVRCRATAVLDGIGISEFPGDGLHIVADVRAAEGAVDKGNANQWSCRNVAVVRNGRHGVYLKGGDANAGCAIQINALANGRWGVFDDSFLGNTHVGHHADSNGALGAGCSSAPNQSSSIVAHGGVHYSVAIGKEAAASTTVPGTDATVWIPVATGGPGGNVPAWASGTAYFSGGAYASTSENARNVFVGCYSEGAQATSQFQSQTLVLGGMHAAGIAGGANVRAYHGALQSDGFIAGDPANAFAVLGGNTALRQVFALRDAVHAPGGYDLRFAPGSGDLVMRYANLDAVRPLTITGPGTTSPVGPHRLAVDALAIGWGPNARLFAVGGGAPTEGHYPTGTRIFYADPVAGGKEGVVCVAGGTPGTWKEFGSIAA